MRVLALLLVAVGLAAGTCRLVVGLPAPPPAVVACKKKKLGRQISKLARKASVPPVSMVVSMVPGIGPVASAGLGVLSKSVKTNRPGGGGGLTFKGVLGGLGKHVAGAGGATGAAGGLLGGMFGKARKDTRKEALAAAESEGTAEAGELRAPPPRRKRKMFGLF